MNQCKYIPVWNKNKFEHYLMWFISSM